MHIDQATFRISEFAQSEGLFVKNDHLLLAVSGGRDSMCMLALCQEIGQPISVAHMNYGLRGDDSDDDAKFVETYCAKNDIVCHVKKVDCRAVMAEESIGLQEAARNLRYQWMQELLLKFNYKAIATAHHQNDNVETFLINLLRGTGIQGLTGIPYKRQGVIRPLMCFSGDEVAEIARDNNILFREDASNSTDDYLRNKIRHHLIPLIEDLKPGAAQILEQNIERIKGQWVSNKTAALKFAESCCERMDDDGGEINLDPLSTIPKAEYILMKLVSHFGFNLKQCASLLQTDKSSGTVFLSTSHEMIRDRTQIKIQRISPAVNNVIEIGIGDRINCDTGVLEITTAIRPLEFSINSQEEYISNNTNDLSPFIVRNWKEGDRLIPIGMTGHQKVSDLLTNLKYSKFQKRNVKVLLKGDDLVWVIGIRMSANFKVENNSNDILRLTWVPTT